MTIGLAIEHSEQGIKWMNIAIALGVALKLSRILLTRNMQESKDIYRTFRDYKQNNIKVNQNNIKYIKIQKTI